MTLKQFMVDAITDKLEEMEGQEKSCPFDFIKINYQIIVLE